MSALAAEDGVYDGQATITIGTADHTARVRLIGHIDPIDGRYHWRGMVFASLPDDSWAKQPVSVTIDRTTTARITERTPWGTYSVAGVGAPPFAL
jgi:hypothetical protein